MNAEEVVSAQTDNELMNEYAYEVASGTEIAYSVTLRSQGKPFNFTCGPNELPVPLRRTSHENVDDGVRLGEHIRVLQAAMEKAARVGTCSRNRLHSI